MSDIIEQDIKSYGIVDGKYQESTCESIFLKGRSIQNTKAQKDIFYQSSIPSPVSIHDSCTFGRNSVLLGWSRVYFRNCQIGGDIIAEPMKGQVVTEIFMDRSTFSTFKGKFENCTLEVISDDCMNHAIGLHAVWSDYLLQQC